MRGPGESSPIDGLGGMSCHEFIQFVREKSFESDRLQDDAYMTNLAALHMSGEALEWFEALDYGIQQDWGLLKRAIRNKYLEPTTEVNDPILGWRGALLLVLLLCLDSLQGGWPALGPTNTAHAISNHLMPKRVNIKDWKVPVLAVNLRYPGSEAEWLQDGQQRQCTRYHSPGTVYWHLVEEGGAIPECSIETGNEHDSPLYSIRVWHKGGLILGKHMGNTGFHLNRAYVSYAGSEFPWQGPFEVLVGNQTALQWVYPVRQKFKAVEGGFEVGIPNVTFVAQVSHYNGRQPGKVFSADQKGYFGWRGSEKHDHDFRVLAWRD